MLQTNVTFGRSMLEAKYLLGLCLQSPGDIAAPPGTCLASRFSAQLSYIPGIMQLPPWLLAIDAQRQPEASKP